MMHGTEERLARLEARADEHERAIWRLIADGSAIALAMRAYLQSPAGPDRPALATMRGHLALVMEGGLASADETTAAFVAMVRASLDNLLSDPEPAAPGGSTAH